MKIELGKKYRDKVTGFEGVATGHHKWLTGCDTLSLQPPVDKDGKVPGTQGFDINRLEEVADEQVEVETKDRRGGPQDSPRQNAHK